ncbi:MAG: M20/M25/M40 family metallo-hydrolase [Bacteroidales bacterium]
MKGASVFVIILLNIWILYPVKLEGQVEVTGTNSPELHDFSPVLQFLASPWFEGRETGTAGGYMAADYIASVMQQSGLKPFNKIEKNRIPDNSDYFQTFQLIRYSIENVQMTIDPNKKNQTPVQLIQNMDFTIEDAYADFSNESELVFIGYGINLPELNLISYQENDVKGKVVLIQEGYPVQKDTISPLGRKLKILAENDEFDLNKRCSDAAKYGSVAMIVLREKKSEGIDNECDRSNPYQDAEYRLPEEHMEHTIPCIWLSESGNNKYNDFLQTHCDIVLDKLNDLTSFKPVFVRNQIKIDIQIACDTLLVHNVIGILPGKDTTHTLIVGAHYDHLGKRGEAVYYGSDDNASGVSGLLALAKVFADADVPPPCNIAFASWTAEEKGLIGSTYFASTLSQPEEVKMYLNMDMISRSAPEDSSGLIISIGTRTKDEYLRKLASDKNKYLQNPFTLDLWDVTGHTGSDYASFTQKDIPVMTFFSGFHDDYHTPCDIPAKANIGKSISILHLVFDCLNDIAIQSIH